MTERLRSAFVTLIRDDEGFYSNDSRDAGGETLWGIARNYHQHWPGWVIVDLRRKGPRFPEILREDTALLDAALEFYDGAFWQPCRAEAMPLPIGEKVFEAAVNVGIGRAVQLLQIALLAQDARPVVAVDGKLGPMTMAAIASCAPLILYDTLQGVQAGYYLGKTTENAGKKLWLSGWLRRALAENDGG